MNNQITLWTLFSLFFRIGCTAFGGFMALIAVVENNVVKKRQWLTHEEMLDTVSLATILVGPIAVNTVAYVGFKLKGVPGAIISMLGVILPSYFLMLILSYAYFSFGEIPAVSKVFMGFMPAVCAIILVAAINMGKKAITNKISIGITLISVTSMVFIPHFLTSLSVIFLSGLAGYFIFKNKNKSETTEILEEIKHPSLKPLFFSPLLVLPFSVSAIALKLFLTFAGMSLLMFGGGYVFIPLIQSTVVDGQSWLTAQEFSDAIALSQIMPGPIVLSTVFIGYKVCGVLGSVAATLGIFMPPAILMLVAGSYFNKIKNSNAVNAVLKGVRPSVVGLIGSAAISIGMHAQLSYISAIIFTLALVAIMKFKIDVAYIIPVAGLIGYFAF